MLDKNFIFRALSKHFIQTLYPFKFHFQGFIQALLLTPVLEKKIQFL
jgi:hypothetical protein